MVDNRDAPVLVADESTGGFGCAVTGAGLQLIAKLIANEEDLHVCRVMVGSGTAPKDIYIGDMTDLVEPVAMATASDPLRTGTTVSMFVEYRSDMNGGLKEGFVIREFGVFAMDGEKEVMIYYGDLSKYPQYIGPYEGYQDIRRYPISLTVAEGTQIKLDGLPSVVVTFEDMKDYCVTTLLPQLLTASRGQIVSHNQAKDSHPDIREDISAAKQAADNAAKAASDAAKAALEAQKTAENSAGGCALQITFAEGCAGQNYTVTGGDEESYTGTVPESLQVVVAVKACNTTYTITTTDSEGNSWTNTMTTGPFFGPCEAEISSFSAELSVTTAPGASVSAVSNSQTYTATADEAGAVVLVIGRAGVYEVTAVLEGKLCSQAVSMTESGGSYTVELTEFQKDPSTSGGNFYCTFEPEDWENGALRISAEKHGLMPRQNTCLCTIRQRIGRTAVDYHPDNAAQGRAGIVDCVEAALNANASMPGTYPTTEDGHVQLTWNQVQYFLLEDILASESTAAAKAVELGFNWQDRDTTGAEQKATLDEVLTAAYLPALGGVSTAFDALCTTEVLQGLRLRRREVQAPYGQRYDLDGELISNTWGVVESQVEWDLGNMDLILKSNYSYPGDVLVLG